MAKRKNKDPGRVRQLHPQRSFSQIVTELSLQKTSGYIDAQIETLGQRLLIQQQRELAPILMRLVTLENIVSEKLGISKNELADRVAAVQDEAEGFVAVSDAANAGDRVRLEIKTKTADQTEFQGASRMLIDNIGSGRVIGQELEGAVVGMKTGEVKTIEFGNEKAMIAEITVNMVSRSKRLAVVPNNVTEAAEETNADRNAG